MKEAQHDVDEANKARDDLASRLKELEKKIRTYEAELNHTQEVHASVNFNLALFPGFLPPVLMSKNGPQVIKNWRWGRAGNINLCPILSVKV